jgi:hypothetical protein
MKLTHEKIVFSKRLSMRLFFFCACPIEDDNGFDRLMKLKPSDDIAVLEGNFLNEGNSREVELLQL